MALTRERDPDALRRALESWLGTRVHEITRPAPGWSCETLVVDRTTVIRLPPIGDGIFPDYDLALQAAVQQTLHASGVPVAAPCRHEPDPSFVGSPFNAMPFVVGTIPRDFTPTDPWLVGLSDDDGRRQVWRTFIDVVARIHAASASGLDLRRVGSTTSLRSGLPISIGPAAARRRRHSQRSSCGAAPTNPSPNQRPACCGATSASATSCTTLRCGHRGRYSTSTWSAPGRSSSTLVGTSRVESVQHDLTGMSLAGFGNVATTPSCPSKRMPAGRSVDLPWYEIFALARASAISTRISILFARAGEASMFVAACTMLAVAGARHRGMVNRSVHSSHMTEGDEHAHADHERERRAAGAPEHDCGERAGRELRLPQVEVAVRAQQGRKDDRRECRRRDLAQDSLHRGRHVDEPVRRTRKPARMA